MQFTDFNTHTVHEYEEFVEGRPNSHSVDTCPTCRYERDHPNDTDGEDSDDMDIDDSDETLDYSDYQESSDDVDMLSEEDQHTLEDVFEDCGLGRTSPFPQGGYDNMYDSDDYSDDSEEECSLRCDGYKDLVFVGEVCDGLQFST